MLTTVDDVVKKLGGPTAVASLTGVGLSAVSNWKSRGRIPAEKFLIFDRALSNLKSSAHPDLFGFETEEAQP